MSNRESTQVVVVGAGVVGLAVARALAESHGDVLVLEAHPNFGMEVSSRNSEVIHAGLYYPTGSFKARACVRGRELLYAYAARRGIEARRIGKLIVAASEAELGGLEKLHARAQANGVADVHTLGRSEIAELEPALEVEAALLSPSTGIIDSHALMLALLGDAEAHGARAVFNTRVDRVEITDSGFTVSIAGADDTKIRCEVLVNCAGLGSVGLARNTLGLDRRWVPQAYLCKGSYFALTGAPAPFRHLIYPVPESAGLGVHLTLDLAGLARFGPDTEWIDSIDYDVDPRRAVAFDEAIRRYWPGLPRDALRPAYSGVRAKIVGPGEPASDFRIDTEREHGVPGLINFFGIESPGLTSALALAEHVAAFLNEG
jgi:L-2-hydroxyglutarate oxidase LhgO